MAQAQVWQLGDMEVGRVHGLELRQDGGKLYADGPVVIYGDVASIGGGLTEQFEPGAMAVADFVLANRQHQRALLLATTNSGLQVERRADGVYASVPLPDTTDGRDTVTMIQQGILAGFSAEFRAHEQRWQAGTRRRIFHATLHGVAIVDKAAYPLSKVALQQRAADYGRMVEKFRLWAV